MARVLLSCLVALTLSLSLGGCGDDDDDVGDGDADADGDGDGDGDADGDGDGDGDADPPACDDGVQNGDEEAVDCGGTCAPCLMGVESTDPETGAVDVPLDRDVRIVFSREIDAALPDDAVTVTDADGNVVAGRVMADRRTLVFTPARYPAQQVQTVTVSAGVSAGPYHLAEPYEFSFTTGDTTSDLSNIPEADYDPLGRGDQFVFGSLPEYGIVWSGTDQTHWVLEDPPYNPAPLANNNAPNAQGLDLIDFASLENEKLPIAGQFDGDGFQETAVVSKAAGASEAPLLTILDRTAEGATVEVVTNLAFDLGATYDAAAGDFDGDGRDELFLAVARSGERIRYSLVDWNPETGLYGIASSGTIESDGSADAQYVKVAAGDVDSDRKDEAVVVWHNFTGGESSTAYYVIIDDLDAGLGQAFPFDVIRENIAWQQHCHPSYVDVATGDIDGDGADEILFGVTENTWNNVDIDWFYQFCGTHDFVYTVDSYSAANPVAQEAVLPAGADRQMATYWYPNGWVDWGATARRWISMLHTADMDGDLQEEVVMHNAVFKFVKRDDPADAAEPEVVDGWPVVMPVNLVNLTGPQDWGFPGATAGDLSDGYLTMDTAVGDVDGDLKEEIVFLRRSGQQMWIEHASLAPGPDGSVIFEVLANELQQQVIYSGYAGAPRLVLPNVDQDSMIVERTGHDLYLGDNVIIALLAAPPCSADIGQDPVWCGTEFGSGTTEEWSDGVYVNAKIGVVAGFEWAPSVNIPFINVKLAKVELEVSAGVEGGYQHSWARGRSESVSFAAGFDNNLVIFKSAVYDRYHYVILAHPDAAQIGGPMVISVPSGYRTMAVSQEYYNESNGEQMDIDDAILAVIPGDLASYPTRASAEELVALPGNRLVTMSSSTAPVPQGDSNLASVELGVSSSESDEFSVGLYLEASLKMCGPDASGWNPNVCVGMEAGFGIGYAYSHEWGSELIFAGTVAGIPAERYAAEAYSVGLYAYETTVTAEDSDETQNFIIVNYFIE